MRKLAIIAFIFSVLSLDAQQIAQYTQYVFNHFSVNPAVAGSKDCLDARLGYRLQWVGFEGAPRTGWASLHGAIKAKNKPFEKNKHGIGAFVETDDAGIIGYSHFYLAYAYHMQVGANKMLSMGVFAGMKQFKLDVGDVVVVDGGDPVVASSATVNVVPEVAPGIWLYDKKMWAGLSMFHALGNNVDGIGVDTRFERHFLMSAGVQVKVGRDATFTPSTLMKFAPGAPPAIDINGMLEFKRSIGIGIGYRNVDAIAFMLKANAFKYFTLGYSYGITTSDIRVGSSNTHEIVLGISACPRGEPARKAIFCPAFE
jgi:type IX secretion system PorP/SprF family membrane protein